MDNGRGESWWLWGYEQGREAILHVSGGLTMRWEGYEGAVLYIVTLTVRQAVWLYGRYGMRIAGQTMYHRLRILDHVWDFQFEFAPGP